MKKFLKIRSVTLAVLLGLAPVCAFAATVSLESSRTDISVGDTVVVTANMDADGASINTVEGNIALSSGDGRLAAREFSLTGSALGLWPRTPSLSSDGLSVSFVGGEPGGFNVSGATMFKMILQAEKEGSVTLTPQDITAYANDGKGTKLPAQTKDLVINIGPAKAGSAPINDWNSLVAEDATPPNDFTVTLGRDNSMFGGREFAFWNAADDQSGISYYEVSEDGAPVVRSGNTYVLNDQSGSVNLVVTAYDKAGNKRVETYPPSAAASAGVLWIARILVVLIAIVAWILY